MLRRRYSGSGDANVDAIVGIIELLLVCAIFALFGDYKFAHTDYEMKKVADGYGR